MNYKRTIWLYVFVVFLGCSQQETETIWINSFRLDCEGVAPQSCLQIQRGEFDETAWELFYNDIKGFDYEAGYIYQLTIAKTIVENPPSDGSAIAYNLVSIDNKERDERLRLNDIWVLTHMQGEAIELMDGGRTPQLEIHLRDKSIFGNAFCNSIRGSFEKLTDKEIIFGAMASTRMICPDQEQEDTFLQLIAGVNRYQIENSQLVLYDLENESLRFKKVD